MRPWWIRRNHKNSGKGINMLSGMWVGAIQFWVSLGYQTEQCKPIQVLLQIWGRTVKSTIMTRTHSQKTLVYSRTVVAKTMVLRVKRVGTSHIHTNHALPVNILRQMLGEFSTCRLHLFVFPSLLPESCCLVPCVVV